MYNLFVSGNDTAWQGEHAEFDRLRCLRKGEYTDDDLVSEYGKLTDDDCKFLISLPCLFAYEAGCRKNARIGRLVKIQQKDGRVRITYVIPKNAIKLTPKRILKMLWDLGISDWEINRTHWALKNEDLHAALAQKNRSKARQAIIDISKHIFDVSLSFPGEHRKYVESVAKSLSFSLGPNRVFYDNFFKAQLARPNADTLLQDIYRKRSRLIVAFVGKAYSNKDWCGLELRAIHELVKTKKDTIVMYVRTDDGEVEGIFSTDGYIDADQHSAEEIAAFVAERLQVTAGSV